MIDQRHWARVPAWASWPGTAPAAGFTLLELLVVMTILALLLSVIPPLLSGVLPRAETKVAVRQLAAGLRYAHSEAMVRHRELVFVLDLEHRRYRIPGLMADQQLPESLKLTMTTARSEANDTIGRIRFFPDGSATGGRITVAGEERTYQVDVDWLTGRVHLDE